jgi:hypothetical protein
MNKAAEEYGYHEPMSEMSHEILPKTQITEADETLMATVSHVQLNGRLSINININIQITAEERTRTVLRPDPDEVIPPNVDPTVRNVYAVEITKDDPDFYRLRPPRINSIIYSDNVV